MPRLNRRVAVCAGGVLLAGAVLLRAQVATPSAPPQAVDFTRDIEPIFRRYCYECHGPAGETQGELRLYAPDLIRAGGASGPVIAPGKSGDSYLIHRILGIGGEDKMPKDRDPLPEATLALLRAWIDQGAVMPAAAASHGDRDRGVVDQQTLGLRRANATGRCRRSSTPVGRALRSTASSWRGSSANACRRPLTRRNPRCFDASRWI